MVFGGSGAGSYSLISDATSGSYDFITSGSNATGAWSFQLQIIDATGAAVNSTATVMVNAAPTVSIAPAGSVTFNVGQFQTFTATASGGTGTLTYQWYLNSLPVGSNSNTYIFSESAGLYLVICNVTDSASVPVSATSNAVTVTVNQPTSTSSGGASSGGIFNTGAITLTNAISNNCASDDR